MTHRSFAAVVSALLMGLSACVSTPLVPQFADSPEARFVAAMTAAGCYYNEDIGGMAGLTPAGEKAVIDRLVASGELEVLIPGYRLKNCI